MTEGPWPTPLPFAARCLLAHHQVELFAARRRLDGGDGRVGTVDVLTAALLWSVQWPGAGPGGLDAADYDALMADLAVHLAGGTG